jgi:hypothetical protein
LLVGCRSKPTVSVRFCRVAELGVPHVSKRTVNARSQGCDVVGEYWNVQILAKLTLTSYLCTK